MKKIFYTLILIISILFISGCTKENINIKDSVKPPTLKESQNPKMRKLYSFYYINGLGQGPGQIILGCFWPPMACLPTVTIYANPIDDGSIEVKNTYNNFINAFNNNKINEFFSSGDYLTLFPELIYMPDVIDGLCSSKIILHYDIGSDDGFDYYIGLPDSVNYLSDWQGEQKCVFVIDNQSN